MKPIRKSRRQVRDEAAGLIFCWRWFRDGLVRRSAVAVLCAVGLFGLFASMIRIKEMPGRVENRETAQVMILRPDSPAARDLLEGARRRSPFPDRWMPRQGAALAGELARIDAKLAEVGRYTQGVQLATPSTSRTVTSRAIPPRMARLWIATIRRQHLTTASWLATLRHLQGVASPSTIPIRGL